MIAGKINLNAYDKSKIFRGQKGDYLDILLIGPKPDQYGNDYMIVQSVTKEERLAGKRGAILGNAKIIGKPPVQSAPRQPATESMDDSDVNF